MPTLNPNGTLHIEEYSFHEFLKHFQDAVLNGYYLDLESNDNFPQKFGDYLTVTLVPGQYTVEEENTPNTGDFSLNQNPSDFSHMVDDGHRGSESNPIDEADALADLNGEVRPSSIEPQAMLNQPEEKPTEFSPEVALEDKPVKTRGRPKADA